MTKTLFHVTLMFIVTLSSHSVAYGEEKANTSNVDILRGIISHLNIKKPESDLANNLKNGDKRFIGINGYTCVVPGITESNSVLVSAYGIHCLRGTSDAIDSFEHAQLMSIAIQYAKQYNKLLINNLSENLP